MDRRSFIKGIILASVAPAIIPIHKLMPVKLIKPVSIYPTYWSTSCDNFIAYGGLVPNDLIKDGKLDLLSKDYIKKHYWDKILNG